MKKITLIVPTIILGFALTAFAQTKTTDAVTAITTAFQKEMTIGAPTIKVPTVVEVSLPNDFSNRFNFAVLDTGTNIFQPYLFTEGLTVPRSAVSVSVQGNATGANSMVDGDSRTFTEFTLPQSAQGQATITLKTAKQLTLSGMSFFLDQYVALPTSIEIRANTPQGEKIILARTRMNSNSVFFPKTTATEWAISLSYGQLLRISEIVLNDQSAGTVSSRTIRFLAQPEHNYKVYFDADRSVRMQVGEAGNLSSNTGVLHLATVASVENASYILADTDSDGIPDIRDNCVSVANSGQLDIDGNGRGDACDDFDKDGVANSIDNCPNDPNSNQSDIDGDKIGDVCDSTDNRVTENYPWLPMAGVGFAGLVLVVLFAVTARSMMVKKEPGSIENQG